MKKIFLTIIILILTISAIHGQTVKKLTISGLRIFTENELYSNLDLKRFDEGKISLSQAIDEIENFYKENGYILVKIYSTDVEVESDETYGIFIDEGRLEKIIIHNLGSFNLLRFRQMLDIPEKIYNQKIINQNLERLQEEFPQFDIRVNVLRTPDYEAGIIQLDRELRRSRFLKHFDTFFLARYRGYNDLHFFVENKNDENSPDNNSKSKKNVNIGFKIHYNFPSAIIPQISFSRDNNFFEKDYFRSLFSVGYDFPFKKLINKSPEFFEFMPHEISFAELRYEYKVSIMDNDFFGPLINGKLYTSHSSRGDLGLIRYDYSYSKTVLAPEFTLLKNFNIYAGLGFEALFIKNTITDRSRFPDIKDHAVYSEFAEVRLKFDPIKIEIGNKLDRYVVIIYDRYFRGSHFEQLELNSIFETEFKNLSILSFGLRGFKLFGKPEFYRSDEVNDKYFLGFTSEDYYTNSKIAFSSEYRFSIYRDFLYLGGFFDTTIFKPEGYIISGTKFGIGYGPSLRILVYDQYQFIVYYGYDVLYPDKEKGINLNMRFSRKW